MNEKINKNKAVSKDAADWLVCALDPFHDFKLRPEGYPDMRCGASLVQMHTQNLDINAGAIGAAWDCEVLYTGFDYPSSATQPSLINGVRTARSVKWNTGDGVSDRYFNSFTVTKAAAGTSCGLTGTGTTTTLPSWLSDMPGRLIGVGFEIHNTTSELYKQGSLTVAQLPDSTEDDQTVAYYSNDATASNRDFQCASSCRYPATITEVTKIPGSNTWEAKDGVYCIPRLVQGDLPIHSGWGSKGVVVNAVADNASDAYINPVAVQAVTLLPYFKSPLKSGFSPMCVYLTNLSKETTLTLTVRTFVEYFPPSTSDFISMATPSPMYDPRALKLYADVAGTAPYAVKVDMNAAGDYFRMVFDAMQKFGPGIGSIIPSPIGKVIGMGVGGIGLLGNSVLNIVDSRKKNATKVTPAMLKNAKQQIVSKSTAGRSAMLTKK